MKYNFVICGSPNMELYNVSYFDIKGMSNALYLSDNIQTTSKFLNKLYMHHFGPRANKFFDLPFKGIWNKLYYKNRFDNNSNICFILTAYYLKFIKYGLIKDIRKQYPNCKIVYFYQDLAKKIRAIAPEEVKDHFDLVLSFDHKDCETYGFTYYPLVYSCTEIEDDPDIPESDVYFVGKAKDRLPEILEAYEKFRDAGLVCDFHITGVSEEDQRYKGEIDYCNQMPYSENLKRIKKTRCMLEIMQGGGHGYTLRYCEAIAHDRRLITNNSEIKNAPFYNPEYISVFKKCSDVDTEFVKKGEKDVNYNFKDQLSPIRLLEFIENYFQTKDNEI